MKYAHVFGLTATTSVIIFPPNSSLKRPGTFLFSPIGRGLLSFLSKLNASNHLLTIPAISTKNYSVLI